MKVTFFALFLFTTLTATAQIDQFESHPRDTSSTGIQAEEADPLRDETYRQRRIRSSGVGSQPEEGRRHPTQGGMTTSGANPGAGPVFVPQK